MLTCPNFLPLVSQVNHLHLHLLSLPLPFRGSLKYRPALPSEAERSSGKLKGWSWFVEVDQVSSPTTSCIAEGTSALAQCCSYALAAR